MSIYTATIPIKHLKAVAAVGLALKQDLTIDLQPDTHFRFWCRDEQKRCAMTGTLRIEEETEGAATIRVPSKDFSDVLATFGTKDTVTFEVIEDKQAEQHLSVSFLDVDTGDRRIMTVQEASPEDLPYSEKIPGGASCTVEAKALSKVLMAYKRHAQDLDVEVGRNVLTVSYANRVGKDSWAFSTETKKQASGKYRTALLAAATTAMKAVAPEFTLTMAPKSMKFVAGTEAMTCRVYVVRSQVI